MGIQLDNIQFRGEIKDGKLVLANQPYFRHHISKFKDCKVTIRIERIKSKRSTQQNNYYWGAILPTIAESTGHTEKELHEIFKVMFIPRKQIEFGKRKAHVLKSTTELTVGEFVEYIMKIQAEVAHLGIELPDPEDYYHNL